jgi:hypothetical protein
MAENQITRSLGGMTELVFAASLKIIAVGSPNTTQFMH